MPAEERCPCTVEQMTEKDEIRKICRSALLVLSDARIEVDDLSQGVTVRLIARWCNKCRERELVCIEYCFVRDGERYPTAYISKSATNVLLDMKKKQARENHFEEEPTGGEVAEQRERSRRLVESALMTLAPHQRHLIELKHLNNVKTRDLVAIFRDEERWMKNSQKEYKRVSKLIDRNCKKGLAQLKRILEELS